MTTKQIADRLVEFCRKGDMEGAQKELFADDAVSIEATAGGGFEKETRGREALAKKGAQWNAMVEKVHSMEMSDPLIATNSFACTLRMHVDMKGKGPMDIKELCVYKVKDGKIISEEFSM